MRFTYKNKCKLFINELKEINTNFLWMQEVFASKKNKILKDNVICKRGHCLKLIFVKTNCTNAGISNS